MSCGPLKRKGLPAGKTCALPLLPSPASRCPHSTSKTSVPGILIRGLNSRAILLAALRENVMRQCYWICFRLFKYFLSDRKPGQPSPFSPAGKPEKSGWISSFVFVHNSVRQQIFEHPLNSGHQAGSWGLSSVRSQRQSRKCYNGENQADRIRGRCVSTTLQSPKGFPEEVYRPRLQAEIRQRVEAVALERKVSG